MEVEVLKSTLGHNTHLWRWLPKHLFIKKISLFQATKTTFLKSHTEFERLMGISTVSLKNVNNILGARTTNKYLFFFLFFFFEKVKYLLKVTSSREEGRWRKTVRPHIISYHSMCPASKVEYMDVWLGGGDQYRVKSTMLHHQGLLYCMDRYNTLLSRCIQVSVGGHNGLQCFANSGANLGEGCDVL